MYQKVGQIGWLGFIKRKSEDGAILLMVLLFAGVFFASTLLLLTRLIGGEMTRIYGFYDREKGWALRCRSFEDLVAVGPEKLKDLDFNLYCLPPRIDHGALPEPRDSVPEAMCYLLRRVFGNDEEKHRVFGFKCLKT